VIASLSHRALTGESVTGRPLRSVQYPSQPAPAMTTEWVD
jgi:hypothetical protein